MRHALISSCLTGLAITFLLGACAAQVDEPLSATQKGDVAAAALVTPAATATTRPDVDSCASAECTTNAECESACHEPSSKCLPNHHCYVP